MEEPRYILRGSDITNLVKRVLYGKSIDLVRWLEDETTEEYPVQYFFKTQMEPGEMNEEAIVVVETTVKRSKFSSP